MKLLIAMAVALAAMITPYGTDAATPPGQAPPGPTTGLKASVNVGGIGMNSNSALMVAPENRQAGRTDSDERYNLILPVVLVDLEYTWDNGVHLFAGTPMESAEPVFKIGVGKSWDAMGRMNVYVAPGLFGKVWEDPYITSGRREDTEKFEGTVGVEWDRIADTGAKIAYRYTRTDIDNDVIGKRFEALERDGNTHHVDAEYAFGLSPGLIIAPGVSYSRGDLNGEANRFHQAGTGISLKKMTPDYFFLFNLNAEASVYDERHPIFDDTREEVGYGGLTMFTWLNPLGYQQWSVTAGAGYFRTESNIDFFDASTAMVLLTTGYHF